MKKLLVLALPALLVLGACGSTASSITTDQKSSNSQLSTYQRNQPVPKGNYSEMRATVIAVEEAEIAGTATTTFFYNQGSPVPIKSCSSIGYPVPATTQLTNPEQVSRDGNGGGNVTLPQSDPTGVFSGSTSGTFVVCVQADGTKRVDYWEGYVETEGGAAKVDSSGVIHDSGSSTVVQSVHK